AYSCCSPRVLLTSTRSGKIELNCVGPELFEPPPWFGPGPTGEPRSTKYAAIAAQITISTNAERALIRRPHFPCRVGLPVLGRTAAAGESVVRSHSVRAFAGQIAVLDANECPRSPARKPAGASRRCATAFTMSSTFSIAGNRARSTAPGQSHRETGANQGYPTIPAPCTLLSQRRATAP